MSSEAKISQGWLIGLAVLALAGMYIPGVCFVIFLAIVGGYLLLSLKWLKEKVIPKKVYEKFETVFNIATVNSPASRRIWRSRAFLPQIVPIP